MPIENYVVGDVIGKGSYGEVTLATSRKDKKKYVIKKIDLHNANTKERTFAQQEVEILSKLRHPNIVSYKESFQTSGGHLAIIMGYCEGGDLYTKLKKQAKQNEFLTETQIVEWFVQIAMALQYMHDRNILHRDLKTQNIFLTKSKIIKLGDLGIARVLDNNSDMATTMIGTPYYMSPELFSNKPYNHKSDVWALGCCVYEMATLKHAFNAKDMNSLVYKILKGKTPVMPKHYSEELLEIIRSMLSHEPTRRPSASRILRHPFIKKHIALFLEGTKNRQTRKSREEKTRKISLKESKGNSIENIVEDVSNPEALATASKVDIQLIDNEEKPGVNSENNEKRNIQEANNNINNNKNSNINERKLKDNHNKLEAKPPEVKEGKEDASSGVKNPSQVRKILHERMQAKAKLKEKRETELKKRKSLEQERISSASLQEDRTEGNPRTRKTSRDKKRLQEKKHDNSRRPLPPPPPPATTDPVSSHKASALPLPRFKSSKQIDNDDGDGDDEKKSKKLGRVSDCEGQPKVSAGVPNMAARRKRRQKQRESQPQFSPPPSASKIDSKTALSCPSFPRKSREEIIRNHLKRNSSFQHEADEEEKDVVDGTQAAQICADDKDDESSSELDDVSNPSSSSHGKGSDVMNLIDTLQATLKMDARGGEGTDNRKSPDESVEMNDDDDDDDALSPTVSGRLKDRITRLRRSRKPGKTKEECIEGVGLDVLKKAYQIIDQYPEEKAEELAEYFMRMN